MAPQKGGASPSRRKLGKDELLVDLHFFAFFKPGVLVENRGVSLTFSDSGENKEKCHLVLWQV